jgi:RNA polymerase sigma-70 factor, ECF subfamily
VARAATVITTSSREAPLSERHSAEFTTEDVGSLVREARNGNRAAFGCLYQLHAGLVHGILLVRVPRIEVDDLVQEVFLSAMRQLSSLRDAKAFGAWLSAIARNRANDFHRKVKEMQPPEQEWQIEGGHGNDSERAEALEALAAIRQLPEAYRETLVLRLVEGMTGPEIASRTGLTPDSVRVNLHRGMKILRERLRKGTSRE